MNGIDELLGGGMENQLEARTLREIRLRENIPEYVLQVNAISQAIYDLKPYERKIIAMAMANLTTNDGENTIRFTMGEFFDALGMVDGGIQREFIKNAVNNITRKAVTVEVEIKEEKAVKANKDKAIKVNEKRRWVRWPWVSKSDLIYGSEGGDSDHDIIIIEFNHNLGKILKEYKKGYSKIDLVDIGKLRSKYAIRFYEIAMSYSGFMGKEVNRNEEWFFEKSIEELRLLFMIENMKYKEVREFRRRIIDKPIEEINEARVGLRIVPEYIRIRKRLIGVKFKCKILRKNRDQVAEDLGIERTNLSYWIRESEKGEKSNTRVFPEQGNPRDQELYQLRKEIAELRETNEILKKAMVFFVEKKPR